MLSFFHRSLRATIKYVRIKRKDDRKYTIAFLIDFKPNENNYLNFAGTRKWTNERHRLA